MLSLGNRTVTLLIFHFESASCRYPPRPAGLPPRLVLAATHQFLTIIQRSFVPRYKINKRKFFCIESSSRVREEKFQVVFVL